MIVRFKCDKFVFEPEAFRIIIENKELKLSHKEAAVFYALCENSMRVVERKYLLSTIWNDSESCDISLNKSILLIRRKLESMGIVNAIDTIPRVGYLLKLHMDTESSISEEEECSNTEQIGYEENISKINLEVKKTHFKKINFRYKRHSIYGGIIFFILILHATVNPFKSSLNERGREDGLPAIQHLSNDEATISQIFLYTSNIQNSASRLEAYREFKKKLKKNKKLYALMSEEALSYLSKNSEGDFLWQKTFLLDQRKSIQTQLDCIAEFINSLDSHSDGPRVDLIPRLNITRMSFYKSCDNQNKSRHIGDLLIRSTLPLDASKPHSTWMQDFAFKNHSGKELFHFKTVSRIHLQDNKAWNRHVSVKSIFAEHFEQGRLQLEPLVYSIFEEFTQDDVYHMLIDDSHNVYVSTAFGAMIYYAQRNPIQKLSPEK